MKFNRIDVSRHGGDLVVVELEDEESKSDYTWDLRTRFIELASSNEEWTKEFLVKKDGPIDGDIFFDFDISDNIIGFMIWNDRLKNFPVLRKKTFALFK